jgi:predicted ATP-grasp superfamily ATP-dependent carboligase
MLAQPFVAGEPLSVSVVVSSSEVVEVFPVGRQRLGDDGTFAYLGGEIPASSPWQADAERLVRTVVAAVPGLFGHVGFDLIGDASGRLWLVEVNPRLTTSYIGYRRRTPQNLAARMWRADDLGLLTWANQTVRFTPSGEVVEGQRVEE